MSSKPKDKDVKIEVSKPATKRQKTSSKVDSNLLELLEDFNRDNKELEKDI